MLQIETVAAIVEVFLQPTAKPDLFEKKKNIKPNLSI
jgi:hypothetical protein